jgi:hypothetical protein
VPRLESPKPQPEEIPSTAVPAPTAAAVSVATAAAMAASSLQFVDTAHAVAVPFSVDDPSALPPLGPTASICAKATHYFQRVKLYKEDRLRSLRPWSEFFSRADFSIPSKLEAFSRIHRNYTYFHSNYVVVVAVLSSYILITNLVFLLSMVLCTAAYHYCRSRSAAGDPIRVFSKELSPTQAYAALVVV